MSTHECKRLCIICTRFVLEKELLDEDEYSKYYLIEEIERFKPFLYKPVSTTGFGYGKVCQKCLLNAFMKSKHHTNNV